MDEGFFLETTWKFLLSNFLLSGDCISKELKFETILFMFSNLIFEEKNRNQLTNSNFAVLYRTNSQSRSIEEALRRIGLKYKVFGGVSFYQRKEVKDLIAYLRFSINQNDEQSFKMMNNDWNNE